MDDIELNDSVHMALLKIHVITGWIVPQAEFMDVLIDQFSKFLREKYSLVNPSEMEFAFRKFGTTVKDWGKQLNLSLIDEVLIPYLEYRREISDKEQQKSVKMIENKEDLSDNSMEDWIESLKDEKRVDFMPVMVYDWLDKKGKLPYKTGEKLIALGRAANYRRDEILNDTEGYWKESYREKFMNMYHKGEFTGNIADTLKTLAKKFLLMDYLNNAK